MPDGGKPMRAGLFRPPQTETLHGGRFGEFDLPILYVCGAMAAWAIIVTTLGGIVVLLGREVLYYGVWVAIAAAIFLGGIAAVDGFAPEGVPAFYGWFLLLLGLVAGWGWNLDGWEMAHRPLGFALAFRLWVLALLVGWLATPAALLYSFLMNTFDRSYPAPRQAVDGLVPPTPWGKARWREAQLNALYGEDEGEPESAAEPQEHVSLWVAEGDFDDY